jgi:hypothetical protein
MRILKQGAHFNSESSVIVQKINEKCSEVDIIQEINQIFHHNKVYRKEIAKWEEKQSGKKSEEVHQFFILGCLVKQTRFQKRLAFIDFDCPEAAQVVIKNWNERFMEMYPSNQLEVSLYDELHRKLREERSKTQDRSRRDASVGPSFTNLYIERLPYSFVEKNLMNIFSNYGKVVSVKIKKPESNVSFKSVNFMPCHAYVNMETHEQAMEAKTALNGKQLLPGTNYLRIEFYRKDNKFLGVHKGLDRKELITNTHYRVLFIRGLDFTLTKDELHQICQKYGNVEVITLKTRVE